MIDWIKRASRGFFSGWLSPRIAGPTVVRCASTNIEDDPAFKAGVREATVAQKNLRLYSIARERDRLKDRIAVLKGQKKKHSHLRKELERLTRMELEIEGSREARMAIGGDV